MAGFFDENNVFNLVLLDPEHNLQPSSATGYQVTSCNPAESDYGILLAEINRIRVESQCSGTHCPLQSAFAALAFHRREDFAPILVLLDREYAEELVRIFSQPERNVESIADLIKTGVLYHLPSGGSAQSAEERRK